MPDDDLPIVIMVTAGGRNDAERLGEALVVDRLATSCSVIPTVHSFYFSEDLLQREHESLLLVRTLASKRSAVMAYLQEQHADSRPAILELQVTMPGLNR